MNCTIYVFPSCYLPSRYKANNVANFPRPPNHRCALLPPGIDFVQRFPCQARRSALRNLPLGNGLYSSSRTQLEIRLSILEAYISDTILT